MFFWSYMDKDFYIKHIEVFDYSDERHKKLLQEEFERRIRLENNPIYRYLHYDLAPAIIESEAWWYLSKKERFVFTWTTPTDQK